MSEQIEFTVSTSKTEDISGKSTTASTNTESAGQSSSTSAATNYKIWKNGDGK